VGAGVSAKEILDATGVKGGLVVHIGCGDGTLTADLRAGEGYLVHALDPDPAAVERARRTVRDRGLYGKVSVDRLVGSTLPYVGNLVKLVVASDPGAVGMDEVMRVLSPGGVAYVKRNGAWAKTVKPRPDEIDEWTHYLYDASGNAVSRDAVAGPPKRLQWTGGPRWGRHHEHMSSVSAMVSAGGRIFYVMDEGSRAAIQLPPKWKLIARDAFSGVILWKRDIANWYTHLYPLKSGPAILPRRLVAMGERVYVALGLDQPLVALDAATGETVRTYGETGRAEEVICSDGVLFIVSDKAPFKKDTFVWNHPVCWTVGGISGKRTWGSGKRTVMAVEAGSGRVLWTKETAIGPSTLAADSGRVAYFDSQKVVCLDRGTGQEKWASDVLYKEPKAFPSFYMPILILNDDVLLFASGAVTNRPPRKPAKAPAKGKRRRGGDPKESGKEVLAFDAAAGEKLWSRPQYSGGHRSAEDLLCRGGLVWTGDVARTNLWTGYDLRTGETKREFKCDIKTYWFHHRCHRSKATERFFMPSRTGIEYVDPDEGRWIRNHWIRGACVYGVMPANGLTYAPQHACACYLETKLNGLNAVAAAGGGEVAKVDEAARLEKGPAYGGAAGAGVGPGTNHDDWPTYRHDAERSGRAGTRVGKGLSRAWQAKIGGRLSAVTVAGGKCFVASIDAHTVHALDAATGEERWRFTAGGRVDSPPTIHEGHAIFGCRDGYVYSVRVSDGELAWSYLAAPDRRRTVAYGQVESLWPVHGSVLVRDDTIHCVAGRSAFLDGGMRLCRINAGSGALVSETVIDDRVPDSDETLQHRMRGLNMPPALPDVLSFTGDHVYMRSQRFTLEGKRTDIEGDGDPSRQTGDDRHLFSSVGFLDGDWFHRSYWLYGGALTNGCDFWFYAGRYAPSGRIMVFDDDTIYGYGRQPKYFVWTPALEYRLFAATKTVTPEKIARVKAGNSKMAKKTRKWFHNREVTASISVPESSAADVKWSQDSPPLIARAMVLAGGTLYVAGPPDVLDEEAAVTRHWEADIEKQLAEQDAAWRDERGAALWAVSAATGDRLQEVDLGSMPVWDGMAAAGGRLYVSTMDGSVVAFSGK
jgi:outer membrane protein assembly factor BamB